MPVSFEDSLYNAVTAVLPTFPPKCMDVSYYKSGRDADHSPPSSAEVENE
jgi:hypothetical protein